MCASPATTRLAPCGGQRLAQPATVDVLSAHDALGAPAVLEIQLAAGRLDAAGIDHAGIAGIGLGVAATRDVVGKTARELDESLRARVDHVGLAQRLELLRSARERVLRRSATARSSTGPNAVAPFAAACAALREIGQYREDRALARLGQTFARVSGAADRTFGQVSRGQSRKVAQLVAEPQQELREDRARVAARAVERGIRDPGERVAGMRIRRALQDTEHRAHRDREIGARVAVRNREYVDLVEMLLPREQPQDARPERAVQAQAVEGLGGDCSGGQVCLCRACLGRSRSSRSKAGR